jgi:hypothetical protein
MQACQTMIVITGLSVSLLNRPIHSGLLCSLCFRTGQRCPLYRFCVHVRISCTSLVSTSTNIRLSGCWLSDPVNNYLGRRGTIFVSAVSWPKNSMVIPKLNVLDFLSYYPNWRCIDSHLARTLWNPYSNGHRYGFEGRYPSRTILLSRINKCIRAQQSRSLLPKTPLLVSVVLSS